MKASRPSLRRGLILIEVLVVIVILVILVGVFLASISQPKAKSNRITCVNNLKNVGLALRTFSTDHGGEFPMALSVTSKGTHEWLTDGSQLWRHWLTLSNELVSPKVLLCPSDWQRRETVHGTMTWIGLTNNSRLSYFLSLNASEEQPQTILAGDRNLTTNGAAVGPGRLLLTTNLLLGFSKEIHNQVGDVLLGDGSVWHATSGLLREFWRDAQTNSGLSTNVWLVP